MIALLLPFFWHKSEAHILLLSKFIKPRELNTLRPEQWSPVLKESLKRAVKRFTKKGFIVLNEGGLYKCSDTGSLLAVPYKESKKAEYESTFMLCPL